MALPDETLNDLNHGLSRRSSVPALKLKPSTPIRSCPFAIMSRRPLAICNSLLGRMEVRIGNSNRASWPYRSGLGGPWASMSRQSKPGHKIRGRDVELLVLTEDLHDRMRIHRKGLAEISDFVRKADFERVPTVIDVFNHLGDLYVCPNQRCVQL